jgi:hypothetical protein
VTPEASVETVDEIYPVDEEDGDDDDGRSGEGTGQVHLTGGQDADAHGGLAHEPDRGGEVDPVVGYAQAHGAGQGDQDGRPAGQHPDHQAGKNGHPAKVGDRSSLRLEASGPVNDPGASRRHHHDGGGAERDRAGDGCDQWSVHGRAVVAAEKGDGEGRCHWRSRDSVPGWSSKRSRTMNPACS